jgi:hypothetical protein
VNTNSLVTTKSNKEKLYVKSVHSLHNEVILKTTIAGINAQFSINNLKEFVIIISTDRVKM